MKDPTSCTRPPYIIRVLENQANAPVCCSTLYQGHCLCGWGTSHRLYILSSCLPLQPHGWPCLPHHPHMCVSHCPPNKPHYLASNLPPHLHGTFSLTSLTLEVPSSRMFPWTVIARQAPLSMRFSRQEYWSGLPFPPPGDLPNPGIEPGVSCIGRRVLYYWAHRETQISFEQLHWVSDVI